MKVLENIPGPLIDPSSHAGSATVIFPSATGVGKGGGWGDGLNDPLPFNRYDKLRVCLECVR